MYIFFLCSINIRVRVFTLDASIEVVVLCVSVLCRWSAAIQEFMSQRRIEKERDKGGREGGREGDGACAATVHFVSLHLCRHRIVGATAQERKARLRQRP